MTSGAGGYNQVTVTREPYAPIQPSFFTKAPRVLPVRVTVAADPGLVMTADISFDATSLGFNNPADLTVYFRPTPGSGSFVALPMQPYNPVTHQVRATMSQFGEFILGYPDVADVAYPPILNQPETYRGVQTNMIVAPHKAESNVVYAVNQELPVSLSWSPRGFARFYDLQIATNASFADPLVVDLSYLTNAFYIWSNALPGTTYQWRVRTLVKTNDAYAEGDWSTNSFQTIAPFLTVTSPNGGELWQRGLQYFIQWNANIQDNVSIELYKGGVPVEAIATNVPGTGVYQWEVDLTLDPGADYSIKVTDAANPSLSDVSKNYFNIDVPRITGLEPDDNGGMILNWTGTSAGVYVEFSPTLSPQSWTEIAGPITGSSWTNTALPNPRSGNFRLRLQ